MLTIYGSVISPYVRKVLITLEFKNIPYQLKSLNPFSSEHKELLYKMNPLGKIPVMIDGDTVIPDSSVICAYLEKKYPEHSLYPSDPASYAKCLWYEEYADAELIDVARAAFRNHERVAPVLQCERNLDAYNEAIKKLPNIFDYLNKELVGKKYLVDDAFTIADISTAATFLNLNFIAYEFDQKRWPHLAAYVATVSQEKCVQVVAAKAIDVFRERFK